MLDTPAVARVLFAISRGDYGQARRLIAAAPHLEPEQMTRLTSHIVEGDAAEVARRIGEELAAAGAERDVVNECYRAAFYLSPSWAELSRNPLYAYFLANRSGGALHKWPHYFSIYHSHLSHLRGQRIRVLEIGVYRGGGLRMWQEYFGPDATIVGADIDEAAKRSVAGLFEVELGDQEDPAFLRRLHDRYGPFDVVIDDGGHTMRQQIVTVETLFPLLNVGGTLIVEDTHTSYWPAFGGGLEKADSFNSWARARVDDLNAQHHPDLDIHSVWATQLGGLHFYDSVTVFDRVDRFRAFNEIVGSSSYLLADQVSERLAVEAAAERDRMREELAVLRRANGGATPPDIDKAISERSAVVDDQARLRLAEAELARQALVVDELQSRMEQAEHEVATVRRTVSWRATAPLRALRGFRRHGR